MTRLTGIAAVGLLLVGSACGTRRADVAPSAPAASISGLELIGEFNIPPLSEAAPLKAARFGGVSGLTIDTTTGEILGICDDHNESRVFVFRRPVVSPPAQFRIDLHAYFPLPSGPGAPEALDPEGIAISRSGRLFISSEGLQNAEPRTPPAIVEYTRGYEYVGQLPVPAKFVPPATGPGVRGVRRNAGFESLTLTPDERRLFTAAESPLVQDGEEAGIDRGGVVRILEYEDRAGTFEPSRELPYPIDAFPRPPFTPRYLVMGIVELLALSNTEFLTMERGYAEEAGEKPRNINHIRIFKASLAGATDIAAMESIRNRRDLVTVRKTLLLDLSTVKGLSPELANLDNFEGMVFGPTLPDGSRTLLIVSDDNFNVGQRTSFLLFRVIEG